MISFKTFITEKTQLFTKKKIDSFHKKLDKLVHKSIGKSSDEKPMKEQKDHQSK